ncbi:hypothetical protein C7475_102732 [Chitinophaga sp. S165]|nr:hypothetical protein C7475_102732 [Chitinophaga sp. S165]
MQNYLVCIAEAMPAFPDMLSRFPEEGGRELFELVVRMKSPVVLNNCERILAGKQESLTGNYR